VAGLGLEPYSPEIWHTCDGAGDPCDGEGGRNPINPQELFRTAVRASHN